ncbi:unnamed protein product [Paramecium pentaurelia]|uniref:Transmembrane protein n=1 Tax=Paramecium pentaurelia TaxID=43138 RepID=A0A8S1V971_9CILI|nr:unnamed protein product [Paramecium pentaurelia]
MNHTNQISNVQIFLKYLILVALIEIQNGCEYQNYEDGLISIKHPMAIYNLEIGCSETTDEKIYSFGFWSLYIPLQEFQSFPQVTSPFKNNVTEDGQLIFMLNEIFKTTLVGYLRFDYTHLQVIHTILVYNQEYVEQIQFIYNAENYEGTWLLCFIAIDTQKEEIKFEMTGQDSISTNFNSDQEKFQIILGGRGHIFETLNLNIFRGRLSKLIQIVPCAFDKNTFEYISQYCMIPEKIIQEQSVYLVNQLQIFDGDTLLQSSIDQLGKKYCLSGWIKYDTSKVIVKSIYPFIRLTNHKNYNKQKNIGDELFKFEVWLYSQLQYLSQIVVQVDVYDIPKRGNQANLVEINGQKLLFDTNNNYYFEGLQKWHFIKYEYGRESDNQKMLLEIQFYNELNLKQISFGNSRYQSSFLNSIIYFYIGGDDFNTDLLQASIYNLKFEHNYHLDKILLYDACHYSCQECDGPMEQNCLSCQINSYRIYLPEEKRCQCQINYLNQEGQMLCKRYEDEFSSIIKFQREVQEQMICHFGYFRIFLNTNDYICVQCPQQNKFDLLCVDCYYNPQQWYLESVCKLDLLVMQQSFGSSYQLKERDKQEYDLYLIDLTFTLELHEGFQEYCNPLLDDINCHQVQYMHLGKQIYVKCKPNYYYFDDDCHRVNSTCQRVDKLGNCILCKSGMYLQDNLCLQCPEDCNQCNFNIQTQKPNCISCYEQFAVFNGFCKQCGSYCQVCQDYYDEIMDSNYLKCYRCINDQKYFISFDGINCQKNQIQNCQYAFQILSNNYQINTLDYYFLPISFHKDIITVCGRCIVPYIFDIKTQQCLLGETVNCEFGVQKEIFGLSPIGIEITLDDNKYDSQVDLDQEDNDDQNGQNVNTENIDPIIIEQEISLELIDDVTEIEPDISIEPDPEITEDTNTSYFQQYCLIAQDQIDSTIIQFNNLCSGHVSNCDTCLLGRTESQITCLVCLRGYYAEKLSGKCYLCPQNLNCFQCYQQQKLQKDNWKDKIRAFYRYIIENNNEHPFTLYGQSQNIQDYEIVCSTCKFGYELKQNKCIPQCSEFCQECQLINNENKCIRCQFGLQGRQLTLYNNQCIQCPQNCALCKVRSLSEIKMINSLFDNIKYLYSAYQCLKSFQDQNYFYDQEIGQFLQCSSEQIGCVNILILPINLYCSQTLYDAELNKKQNEKERKKFYQENLHINDLTSGQSFHQFENDQFYQYGMEQIIKTIIIKITSQGEQVCLLPDNAVIKQQFSQNIFSAINVQIELNFQHYTVFQYQKNLSFVNFQLISITGLVLMPIQNNYIKQLLFVSIFKQQIDLNQINYCQKQQTKDQSIIQIQNVSKLIINDFIVQDLYQTEVQSLINITSTIYPKYIYLKNVRILNSILSNQITLLLFLNLNDKIQIENLVLTSLFNNSILIESKNIEELQVGQIKLSNLSIQSSNILNSQTFVNLKKFQKVEIISISFFDTNINNSILLYLNNQINLINLIIRVCKFQYNSTAITNCNKVLYGNLQFTFENISFIENEYHQTTKFIQLNKQNNNFSELSIKELKILNNFVTEITFDFDFQLFDSSLFYFQLDKIILKGIRIERGYGLIDMSFVKTTSLIIHNIYITQGYKSQFLGLHQYLDCQLQQVKGQYYLQSLYIYSSCYLEIMNIVIEKSQSYNSPIIFYQSADSQIQNNQEQIIITNCIAQKNLLLLTSNIQQTSLFFINSVQNSTIKFSNLTFENNILHEYYQNTLKMSASLIYLECQNCQMQIGESNFKKNFASNTSNSIISIKVQQLKLYNCKFSENSLFQYDIFKQYLLWGFQDYDIVHIEDLSKIFNIRSETGNGYFVVEQLFIKNSIFISSQGFAGAGFSIIAQNDANIQIENVKLYNISTYFIDQNEFGGGIYINSNNVNSISIKISNIQARNISCRYQGGLIYIRSGFNNIYLLINNISAQDIYSQSGSILFVQFSILSQYQQNIYISEVEVRNSFIGYLNFLELNKNLEHLEENKLLFNRTLIYIEYATKIIIEKLTIQNLIYESMVTLLKSQKIQLKDIQISNCQLTNNLIYISPKQMTSSKIALERIAISNILIGQIISNNKCEYTNQQKQLIYFQCLSRFVQSCEVLVEYDKNEELKYSYCLLNQLKNRFQNQNGKIGLIQIDEFYHQNLNKIRQIRIRNVQCQLCNYGFIFINAVDNDKQIYTSEIHQVKITNCSCGIQGCLILSKKSENQINKRILQRNNVQLLQNTFEMLIENYVCLNNTSNVGTCLNVNNLKVLVQNCHFHNNSAIQFGGAILVQDQQEMILINSSIQDNQAQIGGGIYLEKQFEVNYKLLGTVVNNNKGLLFGNNVVGIPQRLAIKFAEYQQILQNKIIINNEQLVVDQTLLSNIKQLNNINQDIVYLPSGQKISNYKIFNLNSRSYVKHDFGFQIVALSLNYEIIQNLDGTYCTINSYLINLDNNQSEIKENQNKYLNIDKVEFNTSTQSYNLDDLIIYFDNQTPENIILQLEFQCNSIRIPIFNYSYPFNMLKEHNNYKLRMNIRTLQCQYGEVKNQTDQSCHQCDSNQGLYSLLRNQYQCEIIDEVSTISVKQAMLKLRIGFWRPYFDTSQVSECFNLPKNCQGGWVEGDTSCYLGHIGALCEQCDLNNIRGDGEFTVSDKFSCSSCQETKLNILFITLISIWTMISILISVQSTIQAIQENMKIINIINMGFAICHNRNQSAILLKMFTNYLQIVGSITTFQLNTPKQLDNTINIFGNPIQSVSYSLDCFLLKYFSLEIHYSRAMWYIIMPFIYINIFIFLYFLGVKIKIFNFDKSVISTTLIYIYIYLQPCLIAGLISLIAYRTISGYQWISINVSYRYDTQQHLFWMLSFCLPILLILALFVPAFFFYGLYSNRNNLDNKQVRLHWGYLYNEYTKTAYFWEIIKIIEKQSIIIFLTYYDDNIIIKATILLLIILMYQQLNQKYKPYNLNNLNKLDYQSANICLISLVLATGIYGSQQSDNYEITLPFLILLTIINFHFIYVLITKIIIEFLKEKSSNYEILFDTIREFIKSYIPCIHKVPYLRRLLINRAQQKLRVNQYYYKLKKFLIPQAKTIIKYKNQQINKQLYEKQIESTYRFSSSNRDRQKMIKFSFRESSSYTSKQSYAQIILDQIKQKNQEQLPDIYDYIPENIDKDKLESK